MGDTVLQVEDIMQSFAQLSETSLKFAFESLNESKTADISSNSTEEVNNNNNNTNTPTTTSTATTDESKKLPTSNGESTTAAENIGDKLIAQVIVNKFDYLPIIQSSIRDESYNWLMSIPNAEQFAKIIGCTLDKVPTVLKSRKDIRATLDTLTLVQLKEALALLGLDQDTANSSEIMIPKIEEEMMMQGIFKLLTKLDKKTLSSFCTDLKIKYHDNLLSLCDTIMSTMYDLEESPDSSTTNTNTPTTPTITTTTINSPPPTTTTNNTTTTTTTASSTSAAIIKSPTKPAPATTNGESPSKSKKKNTPTKSPKSTTKVTSPTPSTTTSATTTTTPPVQSPPQTTTIKTEIEEPKKLAGRSSLNKPSSDKSLIPVVPGKRERKPLPPDPVLSPPEVIKTTRARGNNTTNSSSNNKITTTTTTAAIITTKTTTNGKRKRGTRGLTPLNNNDYQDDEQEEAEQKQVDVEEEEETNSNNRNNGSNHSNGSGDNDENMGGVDDEDEDNHNNHNNSGELDSSLNQQHQENIRKGEPSFIGYYSADKKWICPSFDLITKGVEKSFLQNNYNLSDLTRYCKLNNLTKTKTKSTTIKQILLFTSTGSTPTAQTSNKKKK